MSKQLHKNFTDGQVKSFLEKYSKKEIKINYILQMLKIKRRRFFELLAKYRKDPGNFSIQYVIVIGTVLLTTFLLFLDLWWLKGRFYFLQNLIFYEVGKANVFLSDIFSFLMLLNIRAYGIFSLTFSLFITEAIISFIFIKLFSLYIYYYHN